MTLQELVVKINADTKNASSKIDAFTKKTENMRKGFAQAGKGMMIAGAAIAGGLALCVKNAAAEEQAQIKLATAMKATNQYTDEQFKSLVNLATQLQNTTGIGDEAIQGAMAFGMQMGMTSEQVKEVIPKLLDMSAATGVDLQTAMRATAMATQGQTGMLQRYGVQIKKAEDGTVDFSNILEGFSGYAGSAEAQGQTLTGQINIMKAQFADISKEIGFVLIPILKNFMEKYIKPLIEKFQALSPETKENIAKFAMLAAGILIVGGAVLKLTSMVMGMGETIKKVMAGFNTLAATNPILLAVLAIIAVVALLVWAWKRDFGGIQEKTKAVYDFLKVWVFNPLIETFNFIMDKIKALWNWFERLFKKVNEVTKKLREFLSINVGGAAAPTSSAIDLANEVGSGIPGFAKGGSFTVSRPTLFTAGEKGTERIDVTPQGKGDNGLMRAILRELKKLNEAVLQSSRDIGRVINGMAT